MDATPIDPLHRVSGPNTAWTRVNIAEGVPGISTPLNWSWWDEANERMIRGAYCDIGVLASVQIPDIEQVDQRASAIFFGRPALNVDVSRRMADLQPGTSGEALERHYFGAVRPGRALGTPSRRRYPAIALNLPGQWRRVPGLLEALYREIPTRGGRISWRPVPWTTSAMARAERCKKRVPPLSRQIARPHSVLALLGGCTDPTS